MIIEGQLPAQADWGPVWRPREARQLYKQRVEKSEGGGRGRLFGQRTWRRHAAMTGRKERVAGRAAMCGLCVCAAFMDPRRKEAGAAVSSSRHRLIWTGNGGTLYGRGTVGRG